MFHFFKLTSKEPCTQATQLLSISPFPYTQKTVTYITSWMVPGSLTVLSAPFLSIRWASSVRHEIWHLSHYLTRATPSMYKEDWNVGVVSPSSQLTISSTQNHPLRELRTDSTTEQRRTSETHTARESELLCSQAHSLWRDRKIANTS